MKMKLLPWISFHHDHHLMIARPRGILNEAHVEQTVAMLEELEEKADRPFNRYSDLSKLDAIDLDFNFIVRIALHRRLVYAKYPPVKSAFFVTSPAAARVVKTHALVTDHSPLEVKMFKEVKAAAEWLGVSVDELEMGS